MSLRASCSSCGQKFNAPDNLASKTIKCPKCGGRVTIPAGNGMGGPPNPGTKPNSGIKPTRPSAIPGKSSGIQPAGAAVPAKKSRGKALLFVLLGVGMLGCCVSTAGGVGGYLWLRSQGSAEWREFASKEGNFKVLMPGTPNQAKKPDAKLAEDGGAVHEFVASGGLDTTYRVQFYDLKEAPINNHLFYSQLKDKLLAQHPDSKAGDEQESKLQDFTGIEFTTDLPSAKSVTRRAYLVDNRVYILTAEAPQAVAVVAAPEAKRFFDSFALTTPPVVAQAKPKVEEPPAKDKSKDKPADTVVPKLEDPTKPKVEPKIELPEMPDKRPGGKADVVKMSPNEEKLLELLNKFRDMEKQAKLKQRQKLFDEARKGAELLAKKQAWVRDAGRYGYRQIFHLTLPAPDAAASPQELFNDLILSKSTRRSILDEFEDIGIGMASGEGITYYVLIMGGNSDD